MTEIEVGKLDQVLDFLEANPGLHDQRTWVCGTTACIAGWTVALFDHGKRAGDYLDPVSNGSRATWLLARRASEILGLNLDQRDALFRDTACQVFAEEEAIKLGRALIAESKGELTTTQIEVLDSYGLWTRDGCTSD